MGQEVDTEKKNVWWLIRHWGFHEDDTRSYRIFLRIEENSSDPLLLKGTSLITNRDYGLRSHPGRLRSTDILSHGNNHMLNTTCWLVNSKLSHCWNIASFWSIDKLDRGGTQYRTVLSATYQHLTAHSFMMQNNVECCRSTNCVMLSRYGLNEIPDPTNSRLGSFLTSNVNTADGVWWWFS